MKTQKRFFITNMLKRYTILGACVMLLALFASAAQAETVRVDPGPASILGVEIKYAQDFIIDNQTNTTTLDVLFTDNKMLDWNCCSGGRQAIVLYGPNGCAAYTGQLFNTAGQPAQTPLFFGKVAPCDSPEAIIELLAEEEIGSIRLTSVDGFTADGEYEWTWDDDQPVENRPQVWELQGNQAPIADPGGPYTGNPGESVQFDGSGSSDEGFIADPGGYSWTFGDDETATGSRPTHTYSEAGTYNVCLAVTDDDGVTSSACTTAKIGLVADAGGPYVADGNGTVYFDSMGSLGYIRYWDWDFGDGNKDNLQNPIHNYDNTMGAEYQVTLTLTDTNDNTDVDTTTATVAGTESNLPPIPDAGEPVTGLVGEEVTFDGSGSIDPDGEIVQYDWLFGEGGDSGITDGGPTPTHVYDAPGTYTVTLRVFDDDNVRVDDTTTAEILAEFMPVADANGPYTGEAGAPVDFDSTGSSDPDGGEIQLYFWFFGDGQTSLEEAPSYTYALPGAYTVELYVVDDDGSVSMDTTTANIGFGDNEAPIADAKGPYPGLVSAPVSFNGADSEDPDGEITSFEWDFGDGNFSFVSEPQHTFLEPGVYDVTLTVTDNEEASDVDHTKAIIADGNILPVADVGGPYRGQIGVAVTFDGSASEDLDGYIETYEWDFGDSGSGSGEKWQHTYRTAGLYRVNLTVTDNEEATAADSIMVRIGTASVPPLADAGGPYTGSAGAPVNFDGTGSSDLDDNITTWAWDFGDDSSDSGATPQHSYIATGTYIVTLTVTDASGETDTDVTKVTVGEGSLPPVADAGDTVKGAVGALVIFDGTGSRDPNGGTLTYRWDFGDDTGVSRSAAPSYKYSEEGYYRVTLEVTNSDDKKDSDTTLAVVIETKESCFESCDDARDEALVVCDTVPFWERWGCWLNAFLDHLQCKEACQ